MSTKAVERKSERITDRAAWKPDGYARWRFGDLVIEGFQRIRDFQWTSEWGFNVGRVVRRADGVMTTEVLMGGFTTADAARAYAAKLVEGKAA